MTGISHVINYDVPEYPEDYVHRAGRTARAGRIGYAMTLMSPGEITPVKNIERFIGKALPRVGIQGFADDVHQQNLENEPKPCSTSRTWRATSDSAKCRAAPACRSARSKRPPANLKRNNRNNGLLLPKIC